MASAWERGAQQMRAGLPGAPDSRIRLYRAKCDGSTGATGLEPAASGVTPDPHGQVESVDAKAPT
jgi:hypothetical protein